MHLPKPAAGNGLTTQAEELEKCLGLNQQTRDNYLRYKEYKKGKVLNFLPIRMDIETVSACNFRCKMCTVSDWKNGKRAGFIDMEKLDKIIENQYGLTEAKLTGLGEPMLHGDEYFELIKKLRKKHIWVRMVTNASLLHIDNKSKKLAESGVNDITISIDGATKETFEKIRRQSKFGDVIENCRELNERLAKNNNYISKAWCCVQGDNINELEKIVEVASNAKFPELTFSLNLHGWGREDLLEENQKKTIDNKSAIDIERVERLIKLGTKNDIRISFWDVADKFDASKESTVCPWPFERIYLTSDLRLVPCCMIGDPDTFELTPKDFVEDRDFEKAWNSNEYQNFRRQHLLGEIPEVCRNCYNCSTMEQTH
ncbi:MAG: hypothetical protein CL681_02395 [Blastopirellula sp.]|nr:hypothetical protein [Blastopirellula sp.]